MSKKRRVNRTTDELSKLKADLRSKLAGRETTFVDNVQEKMSDVIEDFIEPYRVATTTDDEYRSLIGIAIIAWNAALLSGPQRATFLKEAFTAIAPAVGHNAQADFVAFLNELIERKMQHFPNNRRYIVNYRITPTPDGLHLSIASSVE